jgi:hypothetical protein
MMVMVNLTSLKVNTVTELSFNKNFAAVKPRTINFPYHSFISIERQNVLAIAIKQIIQFPTLKLGL